MKIYHILGHYHFFRPGLLILFFGSLFVLSFVLYWQQAHTFTSEVITEHIKKLSLIFKEINEECGILNFEHQKNYIDFLTVKSFVGSEIGAMNLIHPEKWSGPYLQDNLTVQEKYYQIVRTKKGYYIVPGEGVTLHNGKKIGTDIFFSEDVDIDALIIDKTLQYKDQPLAAKIMIHGALASDEVNHSSIFDGAE